VVRAGVGRRRPSPQPVAQQVSLRVSSALRLLFFWEISPIQSAIGRPGKDGSPGAPCSICPRQGVEGRQPEGQGPTLDPGLGLVGTGHDLGCW